MDADEGIPDKLDILMIISSCYCYIIAMFMQFCTTHKHFFLAGMLSLKDLSDMVAEKLQELLYVGAEIYGRKDDDMYPCIVSKIIESDVGKIEYEVAWLDKNKEVIETSVINGEDVIQKKLPFSRKFLKSFIRESTYRSAPWVLHDKLAQSYGISKNVPENLRSKVSFKDGLLVCNKRMKNGEV